LNLDLAAAKPEQLEEICKLVNIAYRGDDGWTKETELVSGDRSTVSEIEGYLTDPKAHFLVSIVDDEILCCVCIEDKEDQAYIGLLVVHPKLQGKGVGKVLLSEAEAYARANLQPEKFVMLVVIQRRELIKFYERRGYVRTGEIMEYPIHLNVGTPKVVGLKMEYLVKKAHSKS